MIPGKDAPPSFCTPKPHLLFWYFVCGACAPLQGRPSSTHSRVQISLGPPLLPFLARSQICGKRPFRHVFPFVFLSISTEQLGSNWADFHEILYFSIFNKIYWENSSFIKIWQVYGCFTWRPIYHFDHISLISSWNEKCFSRKL